MPLNRTNILYCASLTGALVALTVALPAWAAGDNQASDGAAMPATKAQTEQLKEIPDGAANGSSSEAGMQRGDMPATKAQQEQLKQGDQMSPGSGADSGAAGSTGTAGGDLPATKAQAEQMREVPDKAAGTPHAEKGMEAGGMPATKAQKEQLKEAGEMSHDKATD